MAYKGDGPTLPIVIINSFYKNHMITSIRTIELFELLGAKQKKDQIVQNIPLDINITLYITGLR